MVETTPMENLNDISWTTLTQSDVHYLDTNNGMPIKVMLNIISKWSWQKAILRVYDVKFKNGHPHYVRIEGFTDYNDRSMEEFLEFIFDVSHPQGNVRGQGWTHIHHGI